MHIEMSKQPSTGFISFGWSKVGLVQRLVKALLERRSAQSGGAASEAKKRHTKCLRLTRRKSEGSPFDSRPAEKYKHTS